MPLRTGRDRECFVDSASTVAAPCHRQPAPGGLFVGPGLLLFSGAGWLALRLRRRADEPASAALNNDQRNRARALLDGAPLPPEEPRS